MTRKIACMVMTIVLSLLCSTSFAKSWTPPRNTHSVSSTNPGSYSAIRVKVEEESLATRCGPSTEYAGAGTMPNMKGRYVTVLSRSIDKGGVPWVEIELEYYTGAYRRCWIGAHRLNLTDQQLSRLPFDYETFLGYSEINSRTEPRVGPGMKYIPFKNRILPRGTKVAVITRVDDYYLVECEEINPDNGQIDILRCWVPYSNVNTPGT